MYSYLEDCDGFWAWLEQCESLCEKMGLPGDWFDMVGVELDEFFALGLCPRQAIEQGLILFTTSCRSHLAVA